ncbi:30S ribosomal protein S8 [Buchnera aphidicola (Neophyllaphis podocarpi)]|uniref:30S ribosomal protein S8 n=1 Tax=Buchnera aphidicola TaxID=9 RepID=UPI0031B7ED0D
MSMQDPISDMLTRIRNAQLANKISVIIPFSRFKLAISILLKTEGYIENYEMSSEKKPSIQIYLKYFHNKPVIENIHRVSCPSLRVYRNKHKLPKVLEGLGIAVISTSRGVMTDREARKQGIGGEVVCYVS